jgi:Txe/YoeB family toxin of Txe-Axe toxin-antitoxin module
MSKSTTLEQLNQRWYEQKVAKHNRTFSSAGKPKKDRWAQLYHAHARRINRQHRMINRASFVAAYLSELSMWGQVTRANRKIIGYPERVYVFGNSGTPQEKQS